jgi:hypothetical protein
MRVARWSVSLMGLVGLVAATMATATVWLLMTDPVTVADSVSRMSQGDVGPAMQALGAVIVDALKGIFKYL